VSTSTRPIQVRIGPRVSAVHLAIVTMALIAGLLTGLMLGRATVQGASATGSAPRWNVQERGPQSHIGQMHRLRASNVRQMRRPARPSS
jgi:hypothetical protein